VSNLQHQRRLSLSKHQRSAGKARQVGARAKSSVRNVGRHASVNPGPGRPTAARVEAINHAILVVAGDEFLRRGYEDARMDTIAEAARVSKGTLYDRYPSKQALLRAVVADRVASWSHDWERKGTPMPTDLRQRLKHRARSFMEYFCSGELESLERLFTSGPPMDELRRIRHEVGHQRTAQVIAQEIIDGTGSQIIQPQTAIRIAEMLMGMLYGWWRTQQETRRVTREEAEAYADHAVDVLFEGFAAWAQVVP
jgi:TetR/AcrR family transcriptional regulator, mexJK operon transcriptional repressor